jgi:hypothetical protein
VREWAEFRWRLNDLCSAKGGTETTLEATNTLA